ncbi:MBOAT, membrane-bound O-acyltransferase family-domain-containing protein [Chytriomyces sp. MP71]|nr:MBOAT, membrane-bound O-acyltransferase family-domain-containing protein [Chytriomyces sp. MP71]
MSHLELALAAAASKLGMPTDVVKGGFMLTSAYPLALVYALIPARQTTLRHLFSVAASASLWLSLFAAQGLAEIAATCAATYVAAFFFREKRWMPAAVFVCVLAHFCARLFAVQVLSSHAQKFDATTPMMVLVIKLTTFAWNVYDGTKKEEDVIPELRSKAIRKFPDLLEFFGFAFFFAAFLVGPAFDFNDYRDYTNGLGVFAVSKEGKSRIPSRILPTLRATLGGLCWMAVMVVFSKTYSYERLVDGTTAAWPLWKRFLFMQACGLVARSKFYTAWLLSEGACNLVGIGYSGLDKNGEPQWDRARNVSVLGFELAQNPKLLIDAWNVRTGFWLKNCVYLRLVKPGQKPGGLVTFATFLTSALWHGFHLGYYLTFSLGAVYSMVGRSMRRNVRPLFLEPSKYAPLKPLYDFLGWLLTWTAINFIASPFTLWALDKSIACWASVGYYALVGLVVMYLGMEKLGGAQAFRRMGKNAGVVHSRTASEDMEVPVVAEREVKAVPDADLRKRK